MIRLLRKDTVCVDVICQCDISKFAWNFGHEWLKGDGDRSLSTWHDMLTAVVPVASPSCNLERSFSAQRRRDATELCFAADCERRHICESMKSHRFAIRQPLSAFLAKNYHEPIIFSKINKRGDTYKRRGIKAWPPRISIHSDDLSQSVAAINDPYLVMLDRVDVNR